MFRTVNRLVIGLVIMSSAGCVTTGGRFNDIDFGRTSDGFRVDPLKFPTEITKWSKFVNVRNTVIGEPDITSPKPAVVILPACSGIRDHSDPQHRMWTKEFIDAGYVVLNVGSQLPRLAPIMCGGMKTRSLSEKQLAVDAYDAIEHLSKIPGVDKDRIFTMGFSLGAMTSGQMASKAIQEEAGEGRVQPRAVAGLYGGCSFYYGKYLYLFNDTNIPLLWLMGDNDIDTKPSDCAPILSSLKEKNPNIIKWKIYPNATHCWDCIVLNGFISRAPNGNTVTYIYNEEVTKQSMTDTIKFFNQFK